MWTRKILKSRARSAVRQNFILCLGANLILAGCVIFTGIITMFFIVGSYYIEGNVGSAATKGLIVIAVVLVIYLKVFILGPIEAGLCSFFYESLNGRAILSDVTSVFGDNYMTIVKGMFLRELYLFLWSLLFVIPGLVKYYEYMMVPYILTNEKDITAEEAFIRSRELMYGQKMPAFILDLSFIGWTFLCGIIPWIGSMLMAVFILPYMEYTRAALAMTLMEHGDKRNDDPFIFDTNFN